LNTKKSIPAGISLFLRRLNQKSSMARFYKLKVAEITRETADCVSIVFDVPATLRGEYNYIQGQYLTLKMILAGEEIRRSYSLCSSPVADREFRVAIKKVKDGKGSTYINDVLKVGDEMDVMTPMGSFHSPMNAANKKHYVLFAGGSGVTPVFSILKTVLKSEPASRISLFYANRDTTSVVFKKQIEELAALHADRLHLFHILENQELGIDDLYKGILTTDKVSALIERHKATGTDCEYFICGPGPMMENVKQVLASLNIENTKIHIEYFTAVIEAVKAAEAKESGSVVKSQVTVIMDGEKLNLDLSSNGKVILDAALDGGMDVPYACKGAVCCTCRAKVMEGKVRMDMNYALTEEEVEQGYVLTCQSHPITERVVVDYDQP
jgi:ring-1,2-phenylacetyl-CoA epoxidase subunit PaaE